jgi:putative ABC transport system substrate-binding protein
MKRPGPAFLIALLLIPVAPFVARAQPAGKVYRIGYLGGFSVDQVLRSELRSLGYVEGQNLVIEGRFHQGKVDRYPALVADLVGLRVDAIICATTVGTTAARDGTRTIPIVMAGAANPMSAGLIASLARPGGNVTGVILQTPDVTAKRVELLREALPGLRRLAAFYAGERTAPVVDHWLRDNDAAARRLGLSLEPVDLGFDPAGWEPVFDGVTRRGISAAVILEGPAYLNGRAQLAALALKYRLAAMFPFSEQTRAGGLMSYGADLDEVSRRAASFVDRILKGARPADLPVEQPTRFPFIINDKTAKALGLMIPQLVLARADEVIHP